MLNHSEELFHPLPSKIVNCYGEYEKEFDEFHPDVNELIKGHDKFSNCAGPFDVPMTHVLLIYLLVVPIVITFIRNGWPSSYSQYSPNVKPYYHIKEELSIVDGIIL